jgi:tetratricopeptide (TPR) repeat protein
MRHLFIISIALFCACHAPVAPVTTTTTTAVFADTSIYTESSVLAKVKSMTGKNGTAEKFFLQANDAYRKQKRLSAAIALYKKSIVIQPTARAYFELGNALGDANKLDEASDAYSIAVSLDYEPLSKLNYNRACIYSRLKNAKDSRECLGFAIESGYTNMKQIMEDKDLAWLRTHDGDAFEINIREAVAEAGDDESSTLSGNAGNVMLWSMFIKEFKQLSFPILLNSKFPLDLSEENELSYDYYFFIPEMRDDRFSRDVGTEYYHVGLAQKTDSFQTVIYASVGEAMDEDTVKVIPPAYYIASYDSKGKQRGKLLLAGREMLDKPDNECTIAGNGDIEIAQFQLKYEKDPDKAGYFENKITGRTFVSKQLYHLGPDGQFMKQDAPPSAQLGMY